MKTPLLILVESTRALCRFFTAINSQLILMHLIGGERIIKGQLILAHNQAGLNELCMLLLLPHAVCGFRIISLAHSETLLLLWHGGRFLVHY